MNPDKHILKTWDQITKGNPFKGSLSLYDQLFFVAFAKILVKLSLFNNKPKHFDHNNWTNWKDKTAFYSFKTKREQKVRSNLVQNVRNWTLKIICCRFSILKTDHLKQRLTLRAHSYWITWGATITSELGADFSVYESFRDSIFHSALWQKQGFVLLLCVCVCVCTSQSTSFL